MDDFRLIVRDPNKAYVSDNLWLPKAKIAEKPIKEALQFWDVEKGNAVLRRLWDETRDHLITPREYIKPSQYPQFPFPFVDLAPKQFPRTNIWVKKDPRDEAQRAALSAFSQSQAGILNLACGKGKTFLALKKAEELGCPALVIVHNTFLMNQWVEEAIPKLLELPPGESVGVVQGQTFDWKHPITVAMIHTLANMAGDGRIPPEFRKHFGIAIWDEVHHLSAPVFLQSASIPLGVRYGLTATDKRADAMDFIYKYHLGDIFFSDLVQKLIPRVYFQATPIKFSLDIPEVKDVNGKLHMSKLGSYMGEHDKSNEFRASCIREALSHGRKIICISKSKIQLIRLHEMFPDSGLIVEETPQAERSNIVRKSPVTFAISNLGSEGLDDDTLDTVFVLLPMGSRNAPPNELQQVMGRIQREKEGRNHPVVVIFDDVYVKPLHYQCRVMKDALKAWDKHVPGMPALDFTDLPFP